MCLRCWKGIGMVRNKKCPSLVEGNSETKAPDFRIRNCRLSWINFNPNLIWNETVKNTSAQWVKMDRCGTEIWFHKKCFCTADLIKIQYRIQVRTVLILVSGRLMAFNTFHESDIGIEIRTDSHLEWITASSRDDDINWSVCLSRLTYLQ